MGLTYNLTLNLVVLVAETILMEVPAYRQMRLTGKDLICVMFMHHQDLMEYHGLSVFHDVKQENNGDVLNPTPLTMQGRRINHLWMCYCSICLVYIMVFSTTVAENLGQLSDVFTSLVLSS